MVKNLWKTWQQYKYRFVPWIALNLKERSVRSIPKGGVDKLVSDDEVQRQLVSVLSAFHHSSVNLAEVFQFQDSYKRREGPTSSSRETEFVPRVDVKTLLKQQYGDREVNQRNSDVLFEVAGFAIERHKSKIAEAGTGVVVTRGDIPEGTVVGMYPGLIYAPYEPILIQSIRNPFIFRCIDGILIDGNDKGISKFLFRSCCQRDRVAGRFNSDMSWVTEYPTNPLAVGQYVNNHSKDYEANVSYQEFDVPDDFPLYLRQYLPNNYYSTQPDESSFVRLTRTVVLVSTRDIREGDELFSTYFTIVH